MISNIKTISIGIIGNGFVGQATNLFKCNNVEVYIYDVDPLKCNPIGTTLHDLCKCNFIFICVPTPMNVDGSCYTGIVETCINNILAIQTDQDENDKSFIIVRSTVPPGTCKKLNVHHMPEFLTEKNWQQDFYETEKWIIGVNCNNNGDDNNNNNTKFQDEIKVLFGYAKDANRIGHNNVTFVNSIESETIKYTRNSFLAVKISFCNEVYQMCQKLGISYDVIRDNFPDYRITKYHTQVPGYDGHFGYGGTCLPKDTNAFSVEMRKLGIEPLLLEASVQRNTKIDRPEQDWNQDKGRAVVETKNI